MASVEQIGLWTSFLLTLMVFSYLLGDNLLYRLAVFVFAGVAAGYSAIVIWDGILIPWLHDTLLVPNATLDQLTLGAAPLLIGLLLLARSWSTRGGRAESPGAGPAHRGGHGGGAGWRHQRHADPAAI